ncbi:MAG: hypothetical protein IGS48_11950 [Oscillatoriales cyanobacterium C42_A2020_001]|nr:hypothetical protein [Leptolyngbyaceae cyanobacterium C42_A2020_001]
MKAELADLMISEQEIERLSGCDVGSIFIGGVFGGVYRTSVFQDPQRLMGFCLTEVAVFLLSCVFTLPLGLVTIRNTSSNIGPNAGMVPFLVVVIGSALLLVGAWNGYMAIRRSHFQRLMHLLDEIDRYHDVIQAIAVLDQLDSASGLPANQPSSLHNRAEVLEALRLTRDSLIASLMTERILRESRGLLARRQELLASIETNLTTVRALEMKHQANEYGQFLNDALEIGMRVQREMQQML